MANENDKCKLKKVAIDVGIIFSVGICILIYFLWGVPYKRGFFCDDESLKHPYHDSTVPSWTLYIYGLALPALAMFLIEFLQRDSHGSQENVQIFRNFTVRYWVWRWYCEVAVFGFGAVCSQLSTDVMKYNVGRLRPHFFSVCVPDTNCTLPENMHRYIENFNCAGKDARKLKEMRLSFPSGHSSFSMYSLFYLCMYLQARWTWQTTLLLRNLLQFLLLLLAIFTGMSRISDYKHHWSDVLAGLLLGMFVAFLVARCVSDLFVKRKYEKTPLDDRTNSNTEMRNTQNGTSQP